MKQIGNRKNFLKATLAISSFILAGCVGQTSDETDLYTYAPDSVQEQALTEKTTNKVEEKKAEPCVIVKSEDVLQKQKKAVISASSPAEPRVVPVKPTNETGATKKAISKETAKSSEKTTAGNITVKQKPESDQALKQTAAEKAEQERLAAEKVEQERLAAEKAEQERLAAEKAEQERLAAEKAEQERLAVEKAEQERLAAEKAEQEKAVAGGVGLEGILDTENAGQEGLATDKTEQELLADQKAEQERMAAEKAEQERLAAQKVEQERLDAEKKAEQERLQKEVEELRAKKEALEEERVRITEIQTTKVEKCEDVKDWVASEGTTLRSLLMEWGNRVGWRVVWNMDRDYTLEAGAVFRGRFVDVAAALLRSFARATPAPKGVFYKGNKVLVISTREDENAD